MKIYLRGLTEKEYRKVHKWIKEIYGTAKYCMINKHHISNAFEWANLSGKYKYETSDWASLCKQCHALMDKHKLSFADLKERERLVEVHLRKIEEMGEHAYTVTYIPVSNRSKTARKRKNYLVEIP